MSDPNKIIWAIVNEFLEECNIDPKVRKDTATMVITSVLYGITMGVSAVIDGYEVDGKTETAPANDIVDAADSLLRQIQEDKEDSWPIFADGEDDEEEDDEDAEEEDAEEDDLPILNLNSSRTFDIGSVQMVQNFLDGEPINGVSRAQHDLDTQVPHEDLGVGSPKLRQKLN